MQLQYRRLLWASTHLSSCKAASSGMLSAAWDACSSLATAPGEKLQTDTAAEAAAHDSKLCRRRCVAAVCARQPRVQSSSSSCNRRVSQRPAPPQLKPPCQQHQPPMLRPCKGHLLLNHCCTPHLASLSAMACASGSSCSGCTSLLTRPHASAS
jgi:hypothetical protein